MDSASVITPSTVVSSRYSTLRMKKEMSRTNERRARRTSATNVTAATTAHVTKMPAPTVVPTPTLGTPVANVAMLAITSHAALPTARNVTPATLGVSFKIATASCSDVQK